MRMDGELPLPARPHQSRPSIPLSPDVTKLTKMACRSLLARHMRRLRVDLRLACIACTTRAHGAVGLVVSESAPKPAQRSRQAIDPTRPGIEVVPSGSGCVRSV